MATPQYYRNISEIKNIEPGALWKRTGQTLSLVDDDQHVTSEFSEEHFRQA